MPDIQKKPKKPKLVFKLDSPFSSPKWPTLDGSTKDAIVQMLSSLLEPIGNRKRQHGTPSKGKRSKKRKRKAEAQTSGSTSGPIEQPDATPPAPPEIFRHITIGFNSTARRLEAAIQRNKATPQGPAQQPEQQQQQLQQQPDELDLVFVTASPASLPYSHLPTLCALASPAPSSTQSHSQPESPSSILLIPLPASAAPRLASALFIPRFSILGILASARSAGIGASPLLEFCRERVKPVDVPWLREARGAAWMGTKIGVQEGGDREEAWEGAQVEPRVDGIG